MILADHCFWKSKTPSGRKSSASAFQSSDFLGLALRLAAMSSVRSRPGPRSIDNIGVPGLMIPPVNRRVVDSSVCKWGSDQSRTKMKCWTSGTRINTGFCPTSIKVCKTFMRRFDPVLEQYGARSNGSHGKYGNSGNVFSVTYRFYMTNTSSNPTLSAINL